MIKAPPQDGPNKSMLIIVLAFGFAIRAAMFFSTPILENDFQRYFLDGNLLISGLNPYDVYPEKLVENLENEDWRSDPANKRFTTPEAEIALSQVNHPHIRTVYPPVAQAAFVVSQAFFPWSLAGWKFFLLLMEIGIILGLYRILVHLGKNPILLTIFWWNPVVIKEFYNSSHMDFIILLPLVWSLLFLLRKRPIHSGFLLAISAGAKLWPLILVPFFMKVFRERRDLMKLLVTGAVTCTVIFLPLLFISWDADSGFVRFGKYWAMNDAIFQLLQEGIQYTFQVEYESSFLLARTVTVALILLGLGYFLRTSQNNTEQILRQMAMFMTLFFILLPTQFPWYYSWLLVFMVFFPIQPILLYSCMIFTYYLRFHFIYRGNPEIFDHKIAIIEHGIIYFLLFVHMWQEFQRANGKALNEKTT